MWAGDQGGPPGGDVRLFELCDSREAGKLVQKSKRYLADLPHRLHFMEVRALPGVCF
jgi:hypothetical protein